MEPERVAIISTAQTELRSAWKNAQHIDLISAVVADVFKGVGLTLDDVDFIIDSGSDVLDGRSISNCGFLGAMGAHHKEESRVEEDGLWAAHYGVTKIAAGAANIGLIIAYSKPSESSVDAYYASQVEPFYQRPVGFNQKAASGIQAQRYLAASDVKEDSLAEIVAARWAAARSFGGVPMDRSPNADEVLKAPMAARPLTETMLSRPVDGAVAMLIASETVAKRLSSSPVWVTGMGHAADTHAFPARNAGVLEACGTAAGVAKKRAGWNRQQVDLAEVSASSVITELMVLEALELAKPNQGSRIAIDGSVAVNASGGALPADPIMATGLVRLAHAVRQLSDPGDYKLNSPTTALVHGAGGVGMQTHCVFTLEV
jgi:acetyl-CoA C-acetyltransferase